MHPWAPDRYLVPLIPVVIMTMAAGPGFLRLAARRSTPALKPPSPWPAIAVLAVLLTGNGLSLIFRIQPGTNIRAWDMADTGYEWSGFEETFTWISRNTPPDARIGSLFDTMYFLYTGRQGVRPWFHHPETYFYPYKAAHPDVGRPDDVVRELRALGIDYLVLDPPRGRLEGDAAVGLLRTVLTAPGVNGRLVFRSADGLHEVYRLWSAPGQRIDSVTAEPSPERRDPSSSL
jgi:hypothetical protein